MSRQHDPRRLSRKQPGRSEIQDEPPPLPSPDPDKDLRPTVGTPRRTEGVKGPEAAQFTDPSRFPDSYQDPRPQRDWAAQPVRRKALTRRERRENENYRTPPPGQQESQR